MDGPCDEQDIRYGLRSRTNLPYHLMEEEPVPLHPDESSSHVAIVPLCFVSEVVNVFPNLSVTQIRKPTNAYFILWLTLVASNIPIENMYAWLILTVKYYLWCLWLGITVFRQKIHSKFQKITKTEGKHIFLTFFSVNTPADSCTVIHGTLYIHDTTCVF